MSLESKWHIDELLESLANVQRIDDGGDLLAFRVAGTHPARSAYVYLYGDDPAAIHYDLEDASQGAAEWDQAVHRGDVWTTQDLSDVVHRWLNE